MKKLRDRLMRPSHAVSPQQKVDRAERLIYDAGPDDHLSIAQIARRIAGARIQSSHDETVAYEDIRHDLALLIEDLSGAANLTFDDVVEPVLSIEDLARRFNVSTKTIARWRRRGLVSRVFYDGGQKRVGFLESSVLEFASRNPDQIRRGSQFSQLSDDEVARIVSRARRLAKAGGCPGEVIRRIAAWMDRSGETIRYTLRTFDRRNPNEAVFPDRHGRIRPETKRRLYEGYRKGRSVESLAQRFCVTKKSVFRAIRESRCERILELPLDYIPSAEFDEAQTPAAQRRILAPKPESDRPARTPRSPGGLPPYLASLYQVPLLTAEQERHLFRKLNFAKYEASRLRERLDPRRPQRALMDRIEKLHDAAAAAKNELVRANLRLVVSISKRYARPTENFFELVSDGNMSLIRAVDKFDYSRGFKFSTYATWAIRKNFARSLPADLRRRERFTTGADDRIFDSAEDYRSDGIREETEQERREEKVERILGCLDPRERHIIVGHFGLASQGDPMTLKEIGDELGVSKERVRQLEARALDKLHQYAVEHRLDLSISAN